MKKFATLSYALSGEHGELITDWYLHSIKVERNPEDLTFNSVYALEDFESDSNFDELIKRVLMLNFDFVFVADGAHFFAFLDDYAERHGLKLPPAGVKANAVKTEAIERHDGDAEYYSRTLWLKVPRPGTRHKRICRTVFFNFKPLVGTSDIDELAELLIEHNPEVWEPYEEILPLAVMSYAVEYEKISGEAFLTDRGPAVWTMGGAAKRYYLALKYPDIRVGRLRRYQNSHPQIEAFEYSMREKKLLLPGTLYVKDIGKLQGACAKYDINSLFPATELRLRELGKPTLATFEEYSNRARAGGFNFEYIVVFRHLDLELKPGMPAIFSNPFEQYTGDNSQIVEINNSWACFAPFFDTLQIFYNVRDMELERIYKLPFISDQHDPAMSLFVNQLYEGKTRARQSGNKMLASLYKFFLNNLHGKFAQKTVATDYIYKLEDNVIKRSPLPLIDSEIKNEWQRKHFDFIRGAYIYSMSRVRYLKTLYYAFMFDRRNAAQNIYYIDTDSVITDIEPCSAYISNIALGDFKLEKIFTEFEAIRPKVYWGRTHSGEIDLTCAGMDKNAVLAALKGKSDREIHELLTDPQTKFKTKILSRCPGGAQYIDIWRAIAATDATDRDF